MKAVANTYLGFGLAILLICSSGRLVQAQESSGAAAFKRLDKNGDGKLTRDEVPTAESFNAADADKMSFAGISCDAGINPLFLLARSLKGAGQIRRVCFNCFSTSL